MKNSLMWIIKTLTDVMLNGKSWDNKLLYPKIIINKNIWIYNKVITHLTASRKGMFYFSGLGERTKFWKFRTSGQFTSPVLVIKGNFNIFLNALLLWIYFVLFFLSKAQTCLLFNNLNRLLDVVLLAKVDLDKLLWTFIFY